MSKRTKLKKAKMPRWIWQLRLKGFHVQLKKYAHFLWRQRPAGCNWSRQLRARYFYRSIPTIRDWDRFLLNHHLAWVSGKGTLEHRIGARPYFTKDTWLLKLSESRHVKTRTVNCPPYTAQQKKCIDNTSSSAAASSHSVEKQQQLAESLPVGRSNNLSPQTPAGFAVQWGVELRPGDEKYLYVNRARFKQFYDIEEDGQMALCMLLAEKDLEDLQYRRPNDRSQK